MNPIAFKEANVIYAKDQPEYLQLPAHDEEGVVTTCWKMTFRERLKVAIAGKLWLQVMTCGSSLQPLKPSIEKPIDEER